MHEKLLEIKEAWEHELSARYGGELEIDYFPPDKDDDLNGYYACAFHNEPKGVYDSWVEKIREFECLGNDKSIIGECHKLNIPVCA